MVRILCSAELERPAYCMHCSAILLFALLARPVLAREAIKLAAVARFVPRLLNWDVSKDELGITAAQTMQIEKIFAKSSREVVSMRKQLGLDQADLRQLSEKDRHTRIEATKARHDKLREDLLVKLCDELATVLTKRQLERLTEIGIQLYVLRMPRFRMSPRLAEVLGLSMEQKVRLDAIYAKSRAAIRMLPDANEAEEIRRIHAESKAEMLDVFTDAQAARLTEIQGKKFDFSQGR